MDWPDHTAHRRQWQIGTTSIPLEPGKFFTHWPRWIDPDELTTTYVDQDGKERCYDVGCNLHQKSTKNAYALRVLYLGLYLRSDNIQWIVLPDCHFIPRAMSSGCSVR